jgi:hypothetical protein
MVECSLALPIEGIVLNEKEFLFYFPLQVKEPLAAWVRPGVFHAYLLLEIFGRPPVAGVQVRQWRWDADVDFGCSAGDIWAWLCSLWCGWLHGWYECHAADHIMWDVLRAMMMYLLLLSMPMAMPNNFEFFGICWDGKAADGIWDAGCNSQNFFQSFLD